MDGFGKLSVRVYTSTAQLPVAGATVVVTTRGEHGKVKLLSVQSTDRNGEIQPVIIATPGIDESTAPEEGQPYADCDVWAEAPGFAVLVMEGVQVFPGVDTVQNMELSPLSQGETSLQETDVRETPDQKL